MGIGFSTFTEVVGAGPSKHFDILGIKMFDSAEIRIHPTGAGIVRTGTKSQGQGHETTWAQIVAEELGSIRRTSWSRKATRTRRRTVSAPMPAAARRRPAPPSPWRPRRVRDKGRKIAAHVLEVSEADVEWKDYAFQVGAYRRSASR